MEKQNDGGFTLLESLLVLMVASLFLLIPTLSLEKWQQTSGERLFFARFEKRMAATQQAAIVRQKTRQMMYHPEDATISFSGIGDNKAGIALVIPDAMVYNGVKEIRFKAISGNYSGMVKLKFTIPEKEMAIHYQFMLGSGKYTKEIIK
ncbi:competence protein ComGD [Enterococcus sp. PF1-24]|uniref:competence type IV pilus minor pilin ComGD n=1 Tax=unclassified Enterococcus TaxID=2608891 RepID=UPI002475011E|nr:MULTISPECIES: competence type IV pilus minor pilin ComGD [unclassified Enterococcus]MDH6365553.1 competence protein ComGD [Enterococcus sp. PFB1-1]MDH6402657.1 competence protein ComGD [Enterococcus sp. PF1-24]